MTQTSSGCGPALSQFGDQDRDSARFQGVEDMLGITRIGGVVAGSQAQRIVRRTHIGGARYHDDVLGGSCLVRC